MSEFSVNCIYCENRNKSISGGILLDAFSVWRWKCLWCVDSDVILYVDMSDKFIAFLEELECYMMLKWSIFDCKVPNPFTWRTSWILYIDVPVARKIKWMIPLGKISEKPSRCDYSWYKCSVKMNQNVAYVSCNRHNRFLWNFVRPFVYLEPTPIVMFVYS